MLKSSDVHCNSLGSINAIASEKKIFLYFPIWSCVNTMTCGDSHLGFRIGIKNPNFLEDLQMIIPGLQTLGFLFLYEIQNGGYSRT
jgi:hypothetical protein